VRVRVPPPAPSISLYLAPRNCAGHHAPAPVQGWNHPPSDRAPAAHARQPATSLQRRRAARIIFLTASELRCSKRRSRLDNRSRKRERQCFDALSGGWPLADNRIRMAVFFNPDYAGQKALPTFSRSPTQRREQFSSVPRTNRSRGRSIAWRAPEVQALDHRRRGGILKWQSLRT